MYRRATGKIQSRDQYINNASLLTKQQQLTGVNEINQLTDQGLPPTNAMVRNFAMELAKKRPGKNWVYRFVDTHSNVLKSGFLTGLDLSRRKADNAYCWNKRGLFSRSSALALASGFSVSHDAA